MTHELQVAGFGGQGVMAIGKLIAEAAVAQNMYATWMPSYGTEMRGGVAQCTSFISDEPILAPLIAHPDELIIMNGPSFRKFIPNAKPNAFIMVNSSIVEDKVEGFEKVLYIPANKIAEDLGNPKALNMVVVGAYTQATKYLKPETIEELIREMFKGPKEKFVPGNIQAFHAGMDCAKQAGF